MNGLYDFGSKSLTGANHIYSTFYDGSNPALSGTPSGTFVSFEDLRSGHSDYDYNDESFVFTNVSAAVQPPPTSPGPPGSNPPGPTPPGPTPSGPPTPSPGVPEPGAWLLMLVGFGGLGLTLRAARQGVASIVLPMVIQD